MSISFELILRMLKELTELLEQKVELNKKIN